MSRYIAQDCLTESSENRSKTFPIYLSLDHTGPEPNEAIHGFELGKIGDGQDLEIKPSHSPALRRNQSPKQDLKTTGSGVAWQGARARHTEKRK
jgi:hypothetical protein